MNTVVIMPVLFIKSVEVQNSFTKIFETKQVDHMETNKTILESGELK